MFIADFITGPGTDKTPCQVRLDLVEYIISKINQQYFINNLSNKYNKDFNNMYYGGTRWTM